MEEKLRNSQHAFISKIFSHTTHEFKNHLAIINESAGLMGDLLGMAKEGGPSNQERYLKIINSIQERVAIASELTLKLNLFGHRMDYPIASFDLNDLLDEELKLLGRYAGQKQVELSLDFSKELPTLNNHPDICQYIFFTCFDYLLNRFAGSSTMRIATVPNGEKVKIVLTSEGTVKDGTENLIDQLKEECAYSLTKMAAELKSENGEGGREELTVFLGSISSGE